MPVIDEDILSLLDPSQLGVAKLVVESARGHGVDPALALGLAFQESTLNPAATSQAGAAGVMQLMPGTASDMGVDDPYDASQNIAGGMKYLRKLLDRYDWDEEQALAAYNWGMGNLDSKGLGSAPEETQGYLRNVPRYAERFRRSAEARSLRSTDPVAPATPPPSPGLGSQASSGKFWLTLPNGDRVQADDSLSTEAAIAQARVQFPGAFPTFENMGGDSSVFDAFWSTANRSTRGLFPGLKAALAAAAGDEEGYDAAMGEIEEATLIASEIAPSLTSIQDIKDSWDNDGVAAGVGKAIEFGAETIFSSFGFQAPAGLAALGGYALGAATLAAGGPITAATLATVAGLGTMFATFLSSDLERAYTDGDAKDTDDLNLLGSMAAAGGQTALNSLTFLLVGGGAALKGVAGAGLSKSGRDIALTSLGKTLNKLEKMHPVKQAAAILLEEEVAEVGQQALERMAAGLPVSPADEGAMNEYVHVMLATLAPGVGFGVGRAGISSLSKTADRKAEAEIVSAARARAGEIGTNNAEMMLKKEGESLQEAAKMVEGEVRVVSKAESDLAADRERQFRENLKNSRAEIEAELRVGKKTQAERKRIERRVSKASAQIKKSEAKEAKLRSKEAAVREKAALEEAAVLTEVTHDDIVKTAKSRNILFNNDPGFMIWMSKVLGRDGKPIGKYEIDKLTPDESRSVISILEKLPVQGREVSFSGATSVEAERVFRESIAARKKQDAPLSIAKHLKVPRGVSKTARDAIAKNYSDKMRELGFTKEVGGKIYANTDLSGALEEQYAKVAPLITSGRFPSVAEVTEKTDIRDPDVIEELRVASVARGFASPSDPAVSDVGYAVSVDGEIVGGEEYSTLADAQEAANRILTQDVKNLEQYEKDRRLPTAIREVVPERDVSVVETDAGLGGVGEVEYKVSSRQTNSWEVVGNKGERLALRSSKKKADGFIRGIGGRVDVLVNGERIGSAKTRPAAQKLRSQWVEGKKDEAYQRAYGEVMEGPSVPGYLNKERESDARKSGKANAEEVENSYTTKYKFVPSESTAQKISGYTVSEKRIGADGKAAESRITEVFPTQEAAQKYVSDSILAAEGPSFQRGEEVTGVDRRAPEEILAERGVGEAPARRVGEFPAEDIPILPTEGLEVAEMSPKEREAIATQRAVGKTTAETGWSPVGPRERRETPSRVARVRKVAQENVVKRLDQFVEDFEAGRLDENYTESEKAIINRKKLSDESRKRIMEEGDQSTSTQKAEWISDLEGVAREALRRAGVPFKLDLYSQKGNQESAAEFLTESMVIQIAVDADLEGKSFKEQYAAIEPFLNHELIHASRRLGLIKASEWKALSEYVNRKAFPASDLELVNASRREAGLDAIPSGSTYMDVAKILYAAESIHKADLDAAKADLDNGNITRKQYDSIISDIKERNWIQDDFTEEAVAFAFQHYVAAAAKNPSAAKRVSDDTEVTVVGRIIKFFRNIMASLKRKKISSPEAIFDTFRAEGELGRRLDRGKALDVWYLRRTNSEEYRRLRTYAADNALAFPGMDQAERAIMRQKAEEGLKDGIVSKEGLSPQEFAQQWITDRRKTSPLTRKAIKAESAGVTPVAEASTVSKEGRRYALRTSLDRLTAEQQASVDSIHSPIPAPASADPRGLRAKGELGDLDSYTWGEFAFNRFGKPGARSRVIVKEGYTSQEPTTGMPIGMGRQYLDLSSQDIQNNTTYSNWEDLLTGLFSRMSPETLKSGEFVVSSDSHDSAVVIWDSPDFQNPVAVTLDYVSDPESEVDGNRNSDYWSIVGLRADGMYSLPASPEEEIEARRGPGVSAAAVVAAERPDLVPKLSPGEERRYALNTSTENLTPEQEQAVDTIMRDVPNPPTSLWTRSTRGIPSIDNSWVNTFRTMIVDKYNRLWQLGYLVKDKTGNPSALLADTSAHSAALMVARASAFFSRTLLTGGIVFTKSEASLGDPLNFDGTTRVKPLDLVNHSEDVVVGFDENYEAITINRVDLPEGKRYEATGGLIPILRMIGNPEKNLVREFFAYARALRALRLRREPGERATESQWSDRDIRTALNFAKLYPEIAVTHKNLQNWNNLLVEFLVDTQVIDREMANEWTKYGDYTPFFVDIDKSQGAGNEFLLSMFQQELGDEKGFIAEALSTGIPSKKLKKAAESKKLMEPIEAISRNAMGLITAGLKNVARNRAIRDAEILGLTDGPQDSMTPGTNITARRGGREYYYIVNDPLLVSVLEGSFMGKNPGLDTLTRILAAPANVLREGITRSPGFILRNIQRDSLNAWVMGADDLGLPILSTLQRYGKNLALQFKGEATEEYNLLSDYGSIGGYELLGVNPKKLKRIFKSKIESKGGARQRFMNVWDAWGEASGRSEAAVREQVFLSVRKRVTEQLLNRGYSTAEAERIGEAEGAFQGLEVLNFSRHGGSKVFQLFTAGNPFMNARMQGLDRLYRAATYSETPNADLSLAKRKAIFLSRGAMLAVVSSMMAALQYGDEDWENLRKEVRENNWMARLPSFGGDANSAKFYALPIPFELGIIFKVIPEAITRAIMHYSDGMSLGSVSDDVLGTIKKHAMTTLAMNPMFQAVRPLVDVVYGYNTWTERPIVPVYMKDVEPRFQYRDTTGALARWAGDVSNISPLNIEHLIRGYTGTLGVYAMDLADLVVPDGGVEAPTRPMTDYWLIRDFIKTGTEGGTKALYYAEMKKGVSEVVATVNKLASLGRGREAMQYAREHRRELLMRDKVKELDKALKEIRDYRGSIVQSGLSGSAKERVLQRLLLRERSLLRNVPRLTTRYM